MSRPMLLVVLALGLIVVLAVGYAIRGAWDDRPSRPAGWCCTRQGQACERSANLASCRTAGGSTFDQSQAVCDTICASPVQA